MISMQNIAMADSICWILHVMKKYWGCIKRCAEDIYMFIQVVLHFIIEAYREMWESETEDSELSLNETEII